MICSQSYAFWLFILRAKIYSILPSFKVCFELETQILFLNTVIHSIIFSISFQNYRSVYASFKKLLTIRKMKQNSKNGDKKSLSFMFVDTEENVTKSFDSQMDFQALSDDIVFNKINNLWLLFVVIDLSIFNRRVGVK